MEHLYGDDHTAHTPADDDVPGTGLGLAIAKTITEQHGGQVWVESEPDAGSVFTIVLPLLRNGEGPVEAN